VVEEVSLLSNVKNLTPFPDIKGGHTPPSNSIEHHWVDNCLLVRTGFFARVKEGCFLLS
jgi:hypothetical protein